MNWFIFFVVALLQVTSPPAQVQLGTSVRPETTTVGQHFIATVRVRVPLGTDVKFPLRPDSGARVDSAGSFVRSDSTVGGLTESTMNYVLAAWDTGSQRLGLDSVVVVTDGTERIAALNGFTVYVRSVLPLDTALRKPKPFRPVVAGTVINWIPWLIAAAILALLGLLVYAWRRWRRHATRGLTALQLAQREFARIDAERLVESGETERYAVEMVRVARTYLATVVPLLARSATTRELAAALHSTSAVPGDRLISILDETDLLKFARERSSVERAVAIGTEARRIVNETAAALAAASAAASAAAVSAAAAARSPTSNARADAA
jgi:hypothetical protein